MRRGMPLAAGLTVAVLGWAGGCADSVDLWVDLRSDLRPGVEVDRCRTELVAELPDGGLRVIESQELALGGPGSLLTGLRVAAFRGLQPGPRRVRVELTRRGVHVAERVVLVQQQGSYALTVLITRDCAGARCPREGDDPEATTCLGGDCVAPGCVWPGDPECGRAECGADPDCAAAAPCADGRCSDGVCVLAARDERCDAGSYCAPERGCQPLPQEMDAGEPTDGGLDGAVDAGGDGGPDAGVDAGPPCVCEARALVSGGDCDPCAEHRCADDCLSSSCVLADGSRCEHMAGRNSRACTTGSGAAGRQYCLGVPICAWSSACCVHGGNACNVSADCCPPASCSGGTCS